MRVNTLLYQKQVEQKQPKQLRLETYKFGKLKLTVQASNFPRNDAHKKIPHRLRAIQEKNCTRRVALNLSAT